MRRSTQNLGLNSLPASDPSGDRCKGYGAISCLKHPDNGYHFLSGASIYDDINNTYTHLSFGDKFGPVVFLFALHEEGAVEPAQLLCLDHSIFMQYASLDGQEPPSANEFVRFNTIEFLSSNQETDQESVIDNATSFKQSMSKLVNYLVNKKLDIEFEEIFRSITMVSADSTPLMQQVSNQLLDESTISFLPETEALENSGSSKKRKKKGSKDKNSKQQIDWNYNNHVTPRKRNATVFYEPAPEAPRVQINKKVSVDMIELDNELAQEDAANKKSKKNKKGTQSKSRKKVESKAKKMAKATTPAVFKTPNSKIRSSETPKAITPAVGVGSETVTNVIIKQQQTQALISKTKDDREEREYLRGQSLLDISVDEKRASNAFDLAERAARMA